MKRRTGIIAALVVLVIAGALAFTLLNPRASEGIQASGTIEAVQSNLSPKVQGRLAFVRVRDGQPVRKGQILAVLEQTTPSLGLQQARANVDAASAQASAAEAAYALQRDTYQTQVAQAGEGVAIAQANLGQAGETLGIETQAAALRVDQARAQLDAAQSAYVRANTELTRMRNLAGSGDEPQRALDDATAQYHAASAQLQAARDDLALAQANRRNVRIRQLSMIASGSAQRQSVASLNAAQAQDSLVEQRYAQLTAARAQLAQARAALALAEDQVSETQIRAPFDGYVVSHNFEAGDLVPPGAAVVTIADLHHPYVYVYVNEIDLPRIKAGMHADVTVDGLPDRSYRGTITEIASSAEFTPENVQTKEQRVEYLVFRVKIQFTDTSGALKPGLPADAVIRV